ncbi:hypothetical protein YTPLAS18_17740 [Nitrospira sp.]|nr:hypothetical protein YTPLAS18_17740 [Nitrospira sp.]
MLWIVGSVLADAPSSMRPLRTLPLDQAGRLLPQNTRLLLSPQAIEEFLDRLEGEPPDWPTVYGSGHADPGHDNRLFQLNRARDALRTSHAASQWRIAFIWPGELTSYDLRAGGFSVAVGPALHATRWGVVRFKPEGLPGNLMAIPDPQLRKTLRHRFERGEHLEVAVVMAGHLVPEESIIYGFSHEQEGVGMVMPVVEVERVEFIYRPSVR